MSQPSATTGPSPRAAPAPVSRRSGGRSGGVLGNLPAPKQQKTAQIQSKAASKASVEDFDDAIREHKLRLDQDSKRQSKVPLTPYEMDLLGDFKSIGVIPQDYGKNRSKSSAASCGLKVQKVLSDSLLNPSFKIPNTMSQARATPEKGMWETALKTELDSFVKNGVWELPDIPLKMIPKEVIIDSRLVFDIPKNADGSIKKFKIRLCGREDRWKDQWGTQRYAGVVKSESVRMILAIAAEMDLELECVDIKTAFLYGDLKSEVIYMRRPPGLTDEDMPAIVMLKKCIYGLPQASNRFREHSDKTLREGGFVPLISDPCVYIKKDPGGFVIAMVHVDDIGFAGTSTALIEKAKQALRETYDISVTQNMHQYLGLQIIRDRPNRTISIHQEGFVSAMCERFWNYMTQDEGFSPPTPMLSEDHMYGYPAEVNPYLNAPAVDCVRDYQAMVGCLRYLADHTRPDILWAVSYCSRRASAPTRMDVKKAAYVINHVKATSHLGLKFHSGEGVVLYATVDASYASHADRKSHTGFTMHIGKSSGSVITLCKKQSIITDSSTYAELVGTHTAAKEIVWARNFLSELGFPQEKPTVLFEDNLSTIAVIHQSGNTNRTKHIDLRYNHIREMVAKGYINVVHLSTTEMTADILTKPLSKTPFCYLRRKILGM